MIIQIPNFSRPAYSSFFLRSSPVHGSKEVGKIENKSVTRCIWFLGFSCSTWGTVTTALVRDPSRYALSWFYMAEGILCSLRFRHSQFSKSSHPTFSRATGFVQVPQLDLNRKMKKQNQDPLTEIIAQLPCTYVFFSPA